MVVVEVAGLEEVEEEVAVVVLVGYDRYVVVVVSCSSCSCTDEVAVVVLVQDIYVRSRYME